MSPELILEFDAAAQALDALAASSTEARASIAGRLSRDITDLRMHGLDDSWHVRWIHGPLRAIRVLEGMRLKLMVEMDEVRQELREVEAELSLLREAGRIADAEFAGRKAVRLLCHEADLKERLDTPVAHRIMAARIGIARILEVSLRQAGREAIRLARESGQPGADPALAREAFARAEAYNKLVAEAQRVTGGVEVPVFLPDHLARLRETLAATGGGAEGRPKAANGSPGAVVRGADAGRAAQSPASARAPASAGTPAPVLAAAPEPVRADKPVPGAPKSPLPRLRGVIVGA
jgi:hypothetical protein